MEVDERLRFLETRITSSLRPRNDDLKALFAGDENRHSFLEFCNNEDVRRLFIYTREPRNTLVASLSPPLGVRTKGVFFIKTNQATKLTKDNIRTDVVFTDCDLVVLNQMELLAKEVYLPLLCTDGVQTYGGVSSDKLMDILHRLMANTNVTEGHVEGRISLPLPSIEVLTEAAASMNRRSAVIHVLESTVVGWIKQIKLVLRHDPLYDLRDKFGVRPFPLDEVELWRQRQAKLISINKQLDSAIASNILLNLDDANSTYSHSFHNVRREISQALAETNENLMFLGTLLPWFDRLHVACTPKELMTVFPPLVHTMLLVWSHSRYYHNADMFHNLLELVSNEVVSRAKSLVGENILKNTIQSYAGLKEALKVCAAYRGTYLDTKDRADDINAERVSETAEAMNLNPPKGVLYSSRLYSTTQRRPQARSSAEVWRDASANSTVVINEEEWSDSPWPPRNAPCFNLLNSFMERCNDLLELVQTTRHFNLLQKAAEVGGAGTKSLDALVREIHQEFTASMEHFGSEVNDILDITESQAFEKSFFMFRSVVKDLERRLASVLRQSFCQCPTIGSQLRLLEVFEGVSGREMVQEYLKDKDQSLISSFTNELIAVRTMFIAKSQEPPLHANLPPIVCKLTWVGALKKRIKEPMEKLRRISPHSLDGDAGWHLRDVFNDTMSDLDKYEAKSVSDWQRMLHAELRDRLKQPLLTAEDYDEETELRPQVLHVNLDPELLLLLREVHYLAQAPFNVKLPDGVRELLRHTDGATLRTTAARLETIVSKYNQAMRSIVDFERPLFERKLGKIDHLLEQGLNHYTWKTTESADFIELASALVGADLHRTLAIVQSNCQEMVEVTQKWSSGALDVFECRLPSLSYSMNRLLDWQRELDDEIERLIKPSGLRIHALLQNSFEVVQISRASPAWEEYVDHMDALVLDGLKQTCLKSLRSMLNTLVLANVSEPEVANTPILTIHMELVENTVTFTPPLDQSTAVTSVLENVNRWLEQFRSRGALVKMLSPLAEGGYKDYISVDDEVIELCEKVIGLVRENSEECMKLLELFKSYTFLWMHDINETFDEFLHGRLTPNPLRDPDKLSPSARLRSAASERSLKSAQSRASSASNYSMSHTGAMGTAEKSFLTPKDEDEEVDVPSLDMFDSEIDIYRTARDEILGVVDKRDVGWIRVDLEPIKQVLTTYASRWMWTFTKYLSDQVTALLLDLDFFLKRIEPEIESITGEERDTASFMKMMRIFNEVSAKQQEMDGQFTAMNRTVLLLKKYGQALPERTKALYDAAPGRWNNLKTKVSLAKQRLGPRIQEESASITKDLAEFGERVEALNSALSASEVYTWDCFLDDAFSEIDKFQRKLEELDNEAQDLIELQDLLETAVVNFTILPECRHELRNLNEVWDTVRTLQEQQQEWKQERWQSMNTKYLREATNTQLSIVKGLPEETHGWEVTKGLEESILVIQACLPLIEDLSNPAMRTRHWKQLVRVTGGALVIDNESLTHMTLGQLLQLGLQNHVDEVRAIVQRAVKDVTIESALKTYEEIWLSKLFDTRPHVRTITMGGNEKTDKDQHSDTKSEMSQSQSDLGTAITEVRSRRRTMSRMSALTLGAGRQKRASVSSLPNSLLNLGEDTGQLFLLKDTDPIFTELESHQVALQGMQSSSAAGSFLDEVTKWQKRLQTIEAVLTVWLEVQEKWVELEEVFSGADVRASLSHEASLFTSANRDFRLLMRATEKNPNVLQCCQRKGILVLLEKMNNNLEVCRRSLLQHLERRRQRFPRFYFLSMEDVLHIVCNGYDITQVNLYLPKLFENLGQLEFENSQSEAAECNFQVTGLLSSLGEKLPLKQMVSCEGPVETWLANLIPMIKTSLQHQLTSALAHETLDLQAPNQGSVAPDSLRAGLRREKDREIHSAGARKVTLNKDERKAGGSRSGSRANSRTGQRVNTGKRPSTRESQEGIVEGLRESRQPATRSWMLDHVTEVVYLAMQIQLGDQVERGLKAADEGDKDSLKDMVKKVNQSIQAAVVMLKGIEDEKEKKARLTKELRKSEASQNEGSVVDNNSVVVSQTGRQSSHSYKGSQWSLNEPQLPSAAQPATPIQEEGSVHSVINEEQGSETAGEVKSSQPVDTMKVVLPPERPKVKVVVEEQVDKTELKLMLFPAQIQKISNLVALMAHQRDIVARLEKKQGESGKLADCFDWKSQLRYAWDESNSALTLKILDAEFEYGYEYQGSACRLALLPGTEKMYYSMASTVKAHMAAMCVGSNLSGRVETVRELSRVVGQPLYVFNCTKTMDVLMLLDIFRGLASTGAWVCFNNLANIVPAALSVLSQLLQTFLEALRAKRPHILYPALGEEISLNPAGACFATLDGTLEAPPMSNVDRHLVLNSPVSMLPSHLTGLFRTVSVTNPEFRVAMEIMLLSQGFTQAYDHSTRLSSLKEMYTKIIPAGLAVSCDNKLRNSSYEGPHGWTLRNMYNVIVEAGNVLDDFQASFVEEEYQMALAEMISIENGENQAFRKPDIEGEDDNEEQIVEKGMFELPESLSKYEAEAIVTALRNTFMPRLHGSDAEMFVTMVTDVFPNTSVDMGFGGHDGTSGGKRSELVSLNTPVVTTHPIGKATQNFLPMGGGERQPLDDIHSAIAVATHELGLLPGTSFQARVAQLAQLMQTHQTVIVTGPPGCGKSEVIKTLMAAQREIGKTVIAHRIFLQAVESVELLGSADPDTKEWRDGLFIALLRKLCLVPMADPNQSKPLMKALHLDGEINSVQMEIFGSLFDHQGMLVLANNERVHIPENLSIFWEIESITELNPGLISRVGVLSMDRSDVDWPLLLTAWIDGRPEKEQDILKALTDRYLGPTMEYLDLCTRPAVMTTSKQRARPKMKRILDTSESNMVLTFCSILDAIIAHNADLTDEQYERYISFAAVWAFGGTLEEKHRSTFSHWWRSTFEDRAVYSEEGEVFDYFVDGESQEMVSWGEAVPPYSMPPHEGIPLDAFVHTVTTEQISYLLGLLSDAGKPVMLVGEAGCGKTSIINDRIRTVCSGEVAEVLSLTVTANRFTTSRVLWQRLEERLEWRHGRTYVPKGNKKLMCLVDDLNLSYVDQFHHQSAPAMVRQHLDSGGFYEPDTHRMREVKNVTYVTTVNPMTPASVPSLNPRLVRHFAVLGMPYPKNSEVHYIFTTLLHTHFLTPATTSSSAGKDHKKQHLIDKEEEKMRALISMVVNVTIEVQERMRSMFLATAERCHYIFSLRDMRRLFQNTCLSLRPGTNTDNLLLLWRHECEWVYGQRLVSPVDFDRYSLAFYTAARKEFTAEEPSEAYSPGRNARAFMKGDKVLQLTISPEQPLFSNLVQQDSGIVTAGGYRSSQATSSTAGGAGDYENTDQYQPCSEVGRVQRLLQDAVEEYNKGHPKIKLTLYKETVQRVCRLARTIMSPHEVGHALLVADGNPGLSNLFARLAASLCGFNVFEISSAPAASSRSYKVDQFKADLVAAYSKAGVKGEKLLLLLTEEDLLEEDFLVYVEEFVVTGAITHLFSSEEQTTIINSIRTEVTAAGLTYTRETAWNFFLKTVRNNFRVVLISADTGHRFQRRCREYPALTEHLNCHWYQHWTREKLVDHALAYLEGTEGMNHIQQENLAHLLATMHLSIRQLDGEEKGPGRYKHLTNTTYEKFVERFLSMYKQRQSRIHEEHLTVTKALQHINRENKLASRLQKQLEHELVVLEERKDGTIKLLSQIGQDKAIAGQQVKIVQKQMDSILKLKQALPRYTLAHERAVYKTVAVVADTKKVVQTLDVTSLGELRAMQKPDVDIEDLMAAIIMILKSPSSDLTWSKGAKRQMANIERFMEELSAFDDSELPESTLNLVEPYLKKSSFQAKNMMRKNNNAAAASLCNWVRGVCRYHRLMISKVKPLHSKVEETRAAIEEAEHKLSMLENKKKALEERLLDLALSFESATVDKNDQEDLSRKMTKQLDTANKFRHILAMEHQHCIQICQSLPQREFAISGAVAMAAAFATYLGPYDPKFRRSVLTVHWPLCLQERGVPLVIDAIDPMKGWIVEWAIHTSPKTRANTAMFESAVPPLDLGQDEDEENQEDGDGEKGEMEETNREGSRMEGQTEREDGEGGQEKGEIEGEGEGQEEGEEGVGLTEEKSQEMKEKEEEMDALLAQTQEAQDPPQNDQAAAAGDDVPQRGFTAMSGIAESQHAYSVDAFPQIGASEYQRYVQSLIKLLVGEDCVHDWWMKGLSLRQMENLAIQKSSWQRPPYLIDPDMEGVRWLRRMIYQHRLVNIDMHSRRHQQIHVYSKDTFELFDPSIVVRIEKAILGGRPLLMMNSEECVDSMSAPLIHHANHGTEEGGSGDARLIKYCGRRLLGHENFRVTLATTCMFPDLSARTASATTLVNYNASPEMLREDLLDRAFGRVMPHLYLEKKRVLRAIQQHKQTLKALEDKLLQVLEGEVSSQEITSHTEYVNSIVDHKEAVFARLQEAEAVLDRLEHIRDQLRPVSKRGAMLYSVVQSLQGVQREYRLALPLFLWMFDQAVGEDLPQEVVQEDGWNDTGNGSDDEDDPHHGKVVPPPRLGSASTRMSERKVTITEEPSSDQPQEGSSGKEDGTEQEEEEEEGTPRTTAPDIVVPDVPTFPTNGMEYNNLSANQVKQLVDCLTQTVFQNTRQSLYDEHRLLFATLLCINIQYETTNIFSEEELALLLQGNPGLGNMELSLLDFGCDAPPPRFLPADKWEDVLAISVLPGALDSLCVQVAEMPEEWEVWYNSSEPERLSLPLRPVTSAGEERPVDERGQTSAQSSPDLGGLNEFHQLILLRLLRPDRFPAAASRYVQRHLTCVKPLPSSLGSIIGSASRCLGIVVLMPPSPAAGNKRLPSELKSTDRPVEILETYAGKKSIPFERIAINEGTEQQVEVAIDGTIDRDGWLVIEDLHLASKLFLANLRGQLIRVGNTGGPLGLSPISSDGQARACIWLTTEPSSNLPEELLQCVRIISWDMVGSHLLEGEEGQAAGSVLSGTNGTASIPVVTQSKDDMLKTATIAALQSVNPSHWQTVSEQSTSVRGVAYGACVVHAVLLTRQTYGARGLSQYQAFSSVQVNHSMEVILGSKFMEAGGQAPSGALEELCLLITEVVYGNMLTDHWDHYYLSTVVTHILTATSRSGGQLVLGSVTVPTPPANVDPADYATWLGEKWGDAANTTEAMGMDDGVKKLVNKASGLDFLSYLDNLYELQHSGPKAPSVETHPPFDSTKIANAVDSITERLPSIVDLGELPVHIVNDAPKYTFPYHTQSLMSLLSAASVEMPQSIGFVLMQECHWFNSLLCHVRQSLYALECCLLQGQYAMEPALRSLAMALQQGMVPASWVHPNRQPCGHTIISWVTHLKRRHTQMQKWIKERKVPRSAPHPNDTPIPDEPRGHLMTIWMGGLVNPTAIITSLRQEKAALAGCLLTDVDIASSVSKSMEEDSFDIVHHGGMYLRDVYLDGASWDVEKCCLAEAKPTLSVMPSIYIRPVLPDEEAMKDEAEAVNENDQQEPPTADPTKVDGEDTDTEQPKLGVYRCPVFLNQSRQVCAFTLDLACPLPVEQWTMSGAALILDPEAPENETRKWPQPSMPPSTRTLEETKASIANEEGGSERGPPSQASRRSLGSKPGSATGLRISSGSRHSAVSRPTNSRQSVRSEKRVTIEEVEEEEEKPKQPLKQEAVAEEMEDGTGGDGTGKIDEEEEEEAAELLLTARSMEIERKRHLKSTFDYRNLAGALNDNQNAYPDEEDEEEADNENANNDAGDEGDYDDGFEAASERSSTRSSHHSDSRASSASLQNGDDRKDVDEDEDVQKEKEADDEGDEDYDKESRKSAQSRQSVQSRHSAKSHHSVKSHHSAESHGSAQSRQSHVNGKASPTESDRNSPYATGSKATDNIKEGKSPMGSRTSLQSKKLSQKSKDEDTASKKSFKAAEGIYGSDKGSKRSGSGGSTRSRTKPEPDKDRASSAESSRSNGKTSPSGKESKDLVPRPPSDAGSRKSGRPGSSGSRRSVRSASSVKSKKESNDDKGKERTSSDDSEHRSGSPGSPKGDKKDHHGSKESLNFFEQAIATITGQDSDDESSKKRAEEAKSAASHGRQSSQGQESGQERESRQGRRSGQLTISQASGSIFNKDDPAY